MSSIQTLLNIILSHHKKTSTNFFLASAKIEQMDCSKIERRIAACYLFYGATVHEAIETLRTNSRQWRETHNQNIIRENKTILFILINHQRQ